MSYSSLAVDDRRRTFVRMLGEIHHALNEALEEEAKKRGLTISEMARLIGKDKGFVSRRLSGLANMTLQTLADLAYALNRPVKIFLPSRDVPTWSNRAPAGEATAAANVPAPLQAGVDKLTIPGGSGQLKPAFGLTL